VNVGFFTFSTYDPPHLTVIPVQLWPAKATFLRHSLIRIQRARSALKNFFASSIFNCYRQNSNFRAGFLSLSTENEPFPRVGKIEEALKQANRICRQIAFYMICCIV